MYIFIFCSRRNSRNSKTYTVTGLKCIDPRLASCKRQKKKTKKKTREQNKKHNHWPGAHFEVYRTFLLYKPQRTMTRYRAMPTPCPRQTHELLFFTPYQQGADYRPSTSESRLSYHTPCRARRASSPTHSTPVHMPHSSTLNLKYHEERRIRHSSSSCTLSSPPHSRQVHKYNIQRFHQSR